MIHRRATALVFFVFAEWRRIEVQGSYSYLWEKTYLCVRYQSMSAVENWNSLAYHTCYIPVDRKDLLKLCRRVVHIHAANNMMPNVTEIALYSLLVYLDWLCTNATWVFYLSPWVRSIFFSKHSSLFFFYRFLQLIPPLHTQTSFFFLVHLHTLETLRQTFFGSSRKLQMWRSHLTNALPSGLLLAVHVCTVTARLRSRNN